MDLAEARGPSRAWAFDRYLWVWLAVAAAPVLFVLTTWDADVARAPLLSWVRFFSLPVLAIEVGVVIFALKQGFEPLRMVRAAPRWVQAALGALVAIAFTTALLVAPDSITALLRTLFSLIHLLFGLAAGSVFADTRVQIRRLLWPLVAAGGCTYTFLLILFVAQIPNADSFDWVYLGFGVINVRQTGFYSAVSAAAALGVAATASGKRAYWVSVAAASLMLALSFWSGTRGSLVAVAVSILLGLAFLPPLRSIQTLAAVLVSTFAGGSLSLLHSPPNSAYGILRISSSAGDGTLDQIGSGRLAMWAGTWKTFLEHPLIGYGESQFRTVVPESQGLYNHPHNLILQVLLQWGLLGALCFFAIAAWLGLRFLTTSRRSGSDAAPAFLAVASLSTMSLYEGAFYHPYPVMMIAVSLAFVLSNQDEVGPP